MKYCQIPTNIAETSEAHTDGVEQAQLGAFGQKAAKDARFLCIKWPFLKILNHFMAINGCPNFPDTLGCLNINILIIYGQLYCVFRARTEELFRKFWPNEV